MHTDTVSASWFPSSWLKERQNFFLLKTVRLNKIFRSASKALWNAFYTFYLSYNTAVFSALSSYPVPLENLTRSMGPTVITKQMSPRNPCLGQPPLPPFIPNHSYSFLGAVIAVPCPSLAGWGQSVALSPHGLTRKGCCVRGWAGRLFLGVSLQLCVQPRTSEPLVWPWTLVSCMVRQSATTASLAS